MKIKRNGQEFELTFSELMEAHDEYELNCAVTDISEIYTESEAGDLDLSDEELKTIAQTAIHNLSKNENYSEAYWSSLKHTFKESAEKLLDGTAGMKIRIYQINSERDTNRVRFESLESMRRYSGNSEVNASIYDKVFEGFVDCKDLEEVYKMFNVKHFTLKDYIGRSLSMSDVVEVVASPKIVGKIVYDNTGAEALFTDFLKYTQKIEELREMDVDFTAHDYVGLNVPAVEKGFYYCDDIGFEKINFLIEKSLDEVIAECDAKQPKQAQTKEDKAKDKNNEISL